MRFSRRRIAPGHPSLLHGLCPLWKQTSRARPPVTSSRLIVSIVLNGSSIFIGFLLVDGTNCIACAVELSNAAVVIAAARVTRRDRLGSSLADLGASNFDRSRTVQTCQPRTNEATGAASRCRQRAGARTLDRDGCDLPQVAWRLYLLRTHGRVAVFVGMRTCESTLTISAALERVAIVVLRGRDHDLRNNMDRDVRQPVL